MTLQRRHFELIADTIAGADIPQVEKNRVIRQFSVVYPTKRKAQKALKDAVVHLEKSQYDPTVERFDGTLPKVEA